MPRLGDGQRLASQEDPRERRVRVSSRRLQEDTRLRVQGTPRWGVKPSPRPSVAKMDRRYRNCWFDAGVAADT